MAIVSNPPCEHNIFVLQQQQNLGRRFGASGMHLSPPPPPLSSFGCCWFAVDCHSHCGILVLCFAVCYFVSILALQSPWWGRESWLLCFVCLPGVSSVLSGSSSRYHGFVCSLWRWYFLIILTYYFWYCVFISMRRLFVMLKTSLVNWKWSSLT